MARPTPCAGPRSTNADDYQHVPRPVAAMPKQFADRATTGWHQHPRAQLLFAVQGAMLVETRGQRWTVPPLRALWIPPGIDHAVTMRGHVAMRTLYVVAELGASLPATCVALEVTPLMRELITRATDAPVLYDDAGPDGLVMKLLIAELARLPVLPISLPLPLQPDLAQSCERLLADLGGDHTLADQAAQLGVSPRTLARRFLSQTGLTFGQWRQRARLLEAVHRLSDGAPVTVVALDLGYDSPSAFTAMFRKALGMTPSELASRRMLKAPSA